IFAGSTSFNASQGFQEFLNTGLLGAVITTIIGCLIWRIIAKIFRFKPDEHFLPKGAAREQELSLSASQEV
ncbi:hypothetical protein TeGR_g9357, partial [Tetraparma gracilis]